MSEKLLQQKGIFIVLDGIDGSGKGTQTKLLVERLKQEGFDVETISFPQYGKKSAGAAEEYLNSNYGMIDAKQASVLYAVDRFDASFQINDWLKNGKVIVTNRYVTASAGHQGGKIAEKADREKFFNWLYELEYGLFKIPVPDTNIIIHMPAEIAQKLVDQKQFVERAYAEGKKRDLHEADINHLKHAEQVFLEIAETFPNTKIVYSVEDGGRLRSPEEVHTMIWEIVSPQLNSIKK
jgi:dTMP kinase